MTRPFWSACRNPLRGSYPFATRPSTGQGGQILLSTVVTLVVVPTLFSLMIEAREALVRLFGRQPPAPATGQFP